MENTKLINSLQNLIRQNLIYAYQKNTPKVHFEHCSLEVIKDKIYLFAGFELSISQHTSLSDEFKQWRFPKSRLNYFEICSNEFQIFVLQYFDDVFLCLQNFNDKQILTFEIESKNNFPLFYEVDDQRKTPSKTFKVQKNSYSLITNFQISTTGKLNPVKYFNDILTHERKIHPLNNLQTEDNSLLQEIDELWAGQTWIDKNGNLDFRFDENNPQDKMALLFLLEIFYVQGKSDNFKNYCSKVLDSGAFLQKINMSLKFEKIKTGRNEHFTDLLLNGVLGDSESVNLLQQTWNEFSTPARYNYCKNFLLDKPHEIAAFIILVVKNNFWWKNKAIDFFDSLIREQKNKYLKLWQLYSKFAQITCTVSCIKQETTFSFYDFPMQSNITTFKNDVYLWQLVKKGSKEICKVEFLDYPAITVDKKVSIIYSGAFITINPFLCEHKTGFKNYCTVGIGKIKVKIFLVWENFTVDIGPLRLKFLFKKNRFQISIKNTKISDVIKIDDVEYSFEKTLYHKIYKTLIKVTPNQNLSFYQADGFKVHLNSIPVSVHNICIHGIAKTRFDQVVNNISIFQNKSKRSQKINPLSYLPEKFVLGESTRINVPKTGEMEYFPQWDTSLLSRLKNTSSGVLSQQWLIFIDSSRVDRLKISKIFYDHLGYYPHIKNMTEMNAVSNKYSLVISEAVDGKIIFSGKYYEEIRLEKSKEKMILRVHPDNLENWLMANFKTIKNIGESS
jgi:hypothetical protein